MLVNEPEETKGGDDIAKTQTRTLPFWDPRVSPQQNEITNEGEEMTERSATLEEISSAARLRCACRRGVAGLNTVRSKLWGRVLPAWLSPELPSVKHSCLWNLFVLSRRFSFTKKNQNSVTTPLCSSPVQVKVTVSRCVSCPPCALCDCPLPLPPPPSVPRLFVQQWDLAVVTVVAAHLAVGGVEVGGVGEGRREGVIVRGGVAGRGKQGLGIRLWRRRWGVVVLVLACGGPAAVA